MDRVPRRLVFAAFVCASAAPALPRSHAQSLPLYTSPAAQLDEAPQRLLAGDVDGDGDADLVPRGVRVSLARSNGDGTFASPETIAGAFASAADHALADLDADGDLDLAELHTSAASLALHANDGSGHFALIAPLLAAPTAPWAIETGDLDADGDVDLLGLFDGEPGLGTGSRATWSSLGGTSYASAQVAALSNHPTLHALADVNGDAYLDLAYAELAPLAAPTLPLRVQLGDSAAAFTAEISSQPFAAASLHAQRIAFADLDHDGKLDLAASSSTHDFLYAASGDGAGAFASAVAHATFASGAGLCIADLDADGWDDVVSAQADGAIGVFAALFGGSPAAIGALHGSGAGAPADVAIGDWNADGLLDVAVGSGSGTRVSIHLGRGARDFADVDFLPLAVGAGGDIECVDWDHDGDLDVVASSSAGVLELYASNGVGALAVAQTLATSATTTRFVAADVDNSGAVDFLALGANGALDVLRAAAPGVFAPAALIGTASSAQDLALADLNLDGRLDVVTSASGGVEWRAGAGDGSFAAATPIALGIAEGQRIALADLELDGWPDVCALFRGGASIATARNAGGGAFAAPKSVAIGTALLDFVAGHLDQDNKYDFIATDGSAQGLWVARNDGSGAFLAVSSFSAPSGGECPRLFDANADAFADVVYTSKTARRPVLALGNGQAQFGNAQALAESNAIEQLTVGDLDADGRCELMIRGARVGVWEALTPDAPSTSLFGTGTSGCLGRMGLAASGAPKIGTASFGLSISNIGAGHGGFLALGFVADPLGTPLAPFGILLHVDLAIGAQVYGAHGSGGPTGRWKAPIPNEPALAGLGLVFQAAWPWSPLSACDPSPFLLSTSRGLAVTLVP